MRSVPAATGEAIESVNPRKREMRDDQGATPNYRGVGPRSDKLTAVGESVKVAERWACGHGGHSAPSLEDQGLRL